MAYVNLKNTTIDKYDQIIYSGDARYKIKITFNETELENADIHLEKMVRSSRVLPDDASKRFTLDNFIAQTIQLTLHDIDTSTIQEPINISLGVLVDSDNEIYEYVPLGVFNIQEKPTTDKGVTTLKLIDNRVKFDTPYNGKELIDANGGSVTKKQVLNDICEKAGVVNDIDTFLGEDDKIGIYDNTIKGTTYVAYMLEQAGCFAIITREGHLGKAELNDLTVHRIPSSIVEENFSKEKDKSFKVERVVYEDAIRKYDSNTDESIDGSTLQTLYLNAANPYISSQEQIESIYTKLKDFEINSVVTQKVMGNPRIDPWDIIEVYDYYSSEENVDNKPVLFRTLANQEFTYTGICLATYKTEIGQEAQKENVTVNSQATLQKWARTEIDNVNAKITLTTGQVESVANEIDNNIYKKYQVDELVLNSSKGVINTFSEAGGNNIFRNTGLWFETSGDERTDTSLYDYWDGALEKGSEKDAANLICFILKAGILTQIEQVANGKYTVSFKYKKLIEQSVTSVRINGVEYSLDVKSDRETTLLTTDEAQEFLQNIEVTENSIRVDFITDTDNSMELYDIMVNMGETKLAYSQNQNEVTTDTVNISKGITIRSTSTDTTFKAQADGIRVEDRAGGVITDFTDEGLKTGRMIAKTEMSMAPIKVVPRKSGDIQGWAFVPTVGDEN